jgi:hypothetical protein
MGWSNGTHLELWGSLEPNQFEFPRRRGREGKGQEGRVQGIAHAAWLGPICHKVEC